MRVSIIIPTYNRPRQIAECLDWLEKLEFPRDQFEVIVVDDGSPIPVTSGSRPYQLTILRQDNAGPASARNHGAAKAKGELLAFIDDDCHPAPDWLGEMVAHWKPNTLVGGRTRAAYEDNPYSVFNQQLLDAVCEWFRQHHSPLDFFASNNILLSAADFARMKGFSTSFPLAAAEDRDFGVRFRDLGGTLYQVQTALMDHLHFQNLASFTEMHFRYGRGAAMFHALRESNPAQYAVPGLYSYLARRTGNLPLLAISQGAVGFGYYFEVARPWLLPLFLYLALALGGQWLAGAWSAEISGSDEASHFVNGVMVSEYLKSILHLPSPLAFARDYYEHFPKVAIGHWPPLFSVFLGLWFLVFPPSPVTALIPIAIILTALATLVYRQVRLYPAPQWLAIAVGALFLLAPLSRSALLELMLEPACSFLVAIAAFFFARRTMNFFSLWSAVALLTKSNAGALALLPPIAVVISRHWHLLRTSAFWRPLPLVSIAVAPWYLYAWPMIAGELMPGQPSPYYVRMSYVFSQMAAEALAPFPLTLILLALAGGWMNRTSDDRAATWAALALSVFAFHTFITPHGETRFYLTALAPVTILAGYALARFPAIAAGAVLAGLAALAGTPLGYKADYGMTPAVDYVRSHRPASAQPAAVLVSSESNGEGAVIARFAQSERHSNWYILRAGKMLSSSTWLGIAYQSRFADPNEVAAYLDRMPISYVILDHHPGNPIPHHRDLTRALESAAWPRVFTSTQASVFARPSAAPLPPVNDAFYADLRSRLGR